MEVIAVIDIGKTNKKILLFNNEFEVVYKNATRFDEVVDEDNYPCDDIESIENWIQGEIKKVQEGSEFTIKAINFSTHGASLIYLDENGERITPLYNYLKPLNLEEYDDLYKEFGGKEEFSRKTASPAYGMLNTGLQILKLQKEKPEFWNKVAAVLHYPQYLSYLFTKKITADFTSVGAHTATWDFDNMQYHQWTKDRGLKLPEPSNGKEAILSEINGQTIAVGSGLHDSSSSIVPVLQNCKGKEFILLSTGTWIIAMNPNSKEKLTQHQLTHNCLCFMTPEKQQIKSSMQFLGRIHEVYLEPLAEKFNVHIDTHLELELDTDYCSELIKEDKRIFLSEEIDTDFDAHANLLDQFASYKEAYYQLIYEISKKVVAGIDLILDEKNNLTDVYVSGGFNRNKMFVELIAQMKKGIDVKIPNSENESALGAALLMKDFL